MNETTPLVCEPSFSIGYRMQHNDNPFFSISIIYIILFDSLIGKEKKVDDDDGKEKMDQQRSL